jgi:nitroimidazol reductase NimA-like FMN-containing flavoprotein (pyridoxamine 5'-phosphate oxidase superfamily)
MSNHEVDAFLRDHWSMVLGTIGPSGQPHLVTMAYGMVGGTLAFTSYTNAQKIVNLTRDPRMTCLVEDPGQDYGDIRGVQMFGTGRIDADGERVNEVLQAVIAQMRRAGRSSPGTPDLAGLARKRVSVFFDVERLVSWDHHRIR